MTEKEWVRGRTEDLDKEMDRLEPDELVVVRVDAEREEQAGVSPVHELVVPELCGQPGSSVELIGAGTNRRTSTKLD